MGRFRDTRTGVVVDVDDVTAEALGAAYVPADEKASDEVKATPANKAAASKSDTK